MKFGENTWDILHILEVDIFGFLEERKNIPKKTLDSDFIRFLSSAFRRWSLKNHPDRGGNGNFPNIKNKLEKMEERILEEDLLKDFAKALINPRLEDILDAIVVFKSEYKFQSEVYCLYVNEIRELLEGDETPTTTSKLPFLGKLLVKYLHNTKQEDDYDIAYDTLLYGTDEEHVDMIYKISNFFDLLNVNVIDELDDAYIEEAYQTKVRESYSGNDQMEKLKKELIGIREWGVLHEYLQFNNIDSFINAFTKQRSENRKEYVKNENRIEKILHEDSKPDDTIPFLSKFIIFCLRKLKPWERLEKLKILRKHFGPDDVYVAPSSNSTASSSTASSSTASSSTASSSPASSSTASSSPSSSSTASQYQKTTRFHDKGRYLTTSSFVKAVKDSIKNTEKELIRGIKEIAGDGGKIDYSQDVQNLIGSNLISPEIQKFLEGMMKAPKQSRRCEVKKCEIGKTRIHGKGQCVSMKTFLEKMKDDPSELLRGLKEIADPDTKKIKYSQFLKGYIASETCPEPIKVEIKKLMSPKNAPSAKKNTPFSTPVTTLKQSRRREVKKCETGKTRIRGKGQCVSMKTFLEKMKDDPSELLRGLKEIADPDTKKIKYSQFLKGYIASETCPEPIKVEIEKLMSPKKESVEKNRNGTSSMNITPKAS